MNGAVSGPWIRRLWMSFCAKGKAPRCRGMGSAAIGPGRGECYGGCTHGLCPGCVAPWEDEAAFVMAERRLPDES